MRYDEMQHIYPWIEELFDIIAGQIHAGYTPEYTMKYLSINHAIILERIQKRHITLVNEKLLQFANAAHNSRALISPDRPTIPCPYCGSLDTAGNKCGLCHNEIAG